MTSAVPLATDLAELVLFDTQVKRVLDLNSMFKGTLL